MKITAFGMGIAAALALAGAALADSGTPTASEKFAEMDVNTDGAVTVGEYAAYAGASGFDEEEAELQFAVMAGDDGVLEIAELEAIMDVEKNEADWKSSTTVDVIEEADSADAETEASGDAGSES